ncbi:MAG: hypothetical protein KDC14_12815 [Planctomycetes bacterium]|nr:hypothetical protein [Planctomycetota bacterium]
MILLVVAALLPRLRDVGEEFDRGVDGERGAQFAVAALNYQRGEAAGAYPVLNLEPAPRPEQRLVDTSEPPLVALVAWNALRLLGPAGWDSAWRDGAPPRGVELPLRVPFVAAQLLALLLLHSVAREAYGPAVALLGLALAGASAVGIQFAGLADGAGPGLAMTLLVVHFTLRWIRRAQRADLALAGASTALAAGVSFGSFAFLPGLWFVAWRRLGSRRALSFVSLTAACTLVPLLLHLFAARAALEHSLTPPHVGTLGQLREIFTPPGLDRLGVWVVDEWQHAVTAHGAVIVVVALSAFSLRSLRALFPRLGEQLAALEHPQRTERELPLLGVLFVGAALVQFAFDGASSASRESLQLWWIPAFSVGGALALHQLGGPLLRLRAGLSPLALLTLAIALPGLGVQAAWRARTRGADQSVPMPSATGAWLAEATPPGSLVLYDRRSGPNRAVGFYAWRTLWPTGALDAERAAQVATALGLGDGPRFWLSTTPDGAPSRLTTREPLRADASLRLWRLDDSATEDF